MKDKNRCRGIASSTGERCRNQANEGSEYCDWHDLSQEEQNTLIEILQKHGEAIIAYLFGAASSGVIGNATYDFLKERVFQLTTENTFGTWSTLSRLVMADKNLTKDTYENNELSNNLPPATASESSEKNGGLHLSAVEIAAISTNYRKHHDQASLEKLTSCLKLSMSEEDVYNLLGKPGLDQNWLEKGRLFSTSRQFRGYRTSNPEPLAFDSLDTDYEVELSLSFRPYGGLDSFTLKKFS